MVEQEVLSDIRERMVRVETKIDALIGTREEVEVLKTKFVEVEARSKSNTHRLDDIEANLTWLWRTLVGAIIVAGIGALAIFK